MSEKNLRIRCAIQIGQPAAEVFEAIVDPEKMSNYFISSGSGRMEAGRTLTWHFPEFEGGSPVHVDKIEKNTHIRFRWGEKGEEMHVEIDLKPVSDGYATVVTVTEGEKPADEAGISWLQGNTEGWANFLACLKAYVEHGINLRKGAFDFMKEENKN